MVHPGSVQSRLVVLGSCGGWPEPGRACSGYLLEHAGSRIVFDLGYGTLPRLLELLKSPVGDGIDAVVITHAHPDHLVDAHALFRARWFSQDSASPIPLYASDGVQEMLAGLEHGDVDAIASVFDIHPLPADSYRVGPFVLESWALPHYVPTPEYGCPLPTSRSRTRATPDRTWRWPTSAAMPTSSSSTRPTAISSPHHFPNLPDRAAP